jgi:uncharacterized phage-like protein YoqJ
VFLKDNLSLIKFGDLNIFDNKNKKYISFKKDTLFKVLDSLLEDNKEYTVIEIEYSCYFKKYLVEEIHLSFKAFFDD